MIKKEHMKIKFSSRANSQLSLFLDLGLRETGFVVGMDLGKYKIIESLIPISFNKKNICDIYRKIYNKIGNKLIGVFFFNKHIFLDDWFIEDIIIKVKDNDIKVFLYEINSKSSEKTLQEIKYSGR